MTCSPVLRASSSLFLLRRAGRIREAGCLSAFALTEYAIRIVRTSFFTPLDVASSRPLTLRSPKRRTFEQRRRVAVRKLTRHERRAQPRHSSSFEGTSMQFRSLATLGVALALAVTAACTDNTSPNGTLSTGLYALASVNGAGLPYTYSNSNTGGTTTLQSDVYSINNDGTYSEVIQETASNGFGSSPTTDNESGVWTQNGNTITFQPTYSTFSNNTAYSGTLSNGGLFSGSTLVFSSSLGQLVYQHE
jgi:hypothetical protein